jgi:Ni,Fe-hydrogenase III large subunit/Ni,Fe-hydrogenase III component G
MSDPQSTLSDVLAALGARSAGEGMLEARVAPDTLPEACRLLRDQGQARLLTMLGQDARATRGAFRLLCIFGLLPTGSVLSLRVELPPDVPAYPSATPVLPAAAWHEREIRDLLGLVPLGHPDPRPLVRHAGWPREYFPLRKDAEPRAPLPGDGPPSGDAGQDWPHPADQAMGYPPMPDSEGGSVVFGPLPEGIGEAAQVRVALQGDTISALESRLFYTHRGAEKLCEGRSPEQALEIVERICGACSFANALACCRALEACMGLEVPPRAQFLRALFLELERLHGLAGDIATLAAGAGLPSVEGRCAMLRESLLALNLALTGIRLPRGLLAPGGMRRDLPAGAPGAIASVLRRGQALWQEVEARVMGDGALLARLRGLGVLRSDIADALGVVGPVARASDLPRDARLEMPGDADRAVAPVMIRRAEADAEARVLVRLAGASDSFRMIAALLESVPGGPIAAPAGQGGGDAHGLGIAESARGENVCWVALSGGLVERLHLRCASYTVWPAVPAVASGTRIADLPLLLASFGLCVACVDR